MNRLSRKIRNITKSQSFAMNLKSLEMQNQGIDIINLSVGESDYFTPNYIKEAAKKAIEENFSYYSPTAGFSDLREAILEKFHNVNNLQYNLENVMVSNGAKHSIANLLMVLIEEGDEVIIPAPYWVSFTELTKFAGGKNVIIKTNIDSDFKVTSSQIEEAITDKTKVLILCSPNNPTGSVYNRSELKKIASMLTRYPNIVVISDEVYEYINFLDKHESIASFEEIKDRVVIVNSASKTYAMTGWRVGYMVGPSWIIEACDKLQGQFTAGASSIAQKAAVAALRGDISFTLEMKKAFIQRRDFVIDRIKKIEGIRTFIPDGGFFIFPDISYFFGFNFNGIEIKNADDLCSFLLEHAHVTTISGDAFGAPEHIRISFVLNEYKLNEAFNRIEKALIFLQE